jgi:hypothetical protein
LLFSFKQARARIQSSQRNAQNNPNAIQKIFLKPRAQNHATASANSTGRYFSHASRCEDEKFGVWTFTTTSLRTVIGARVGWPFSMRDARVKRQRSRVTGVMQAARLWVPRTRRTSHGMGQR